MSAVVEVDVQNASGIAQVPDEQLIGDWISQVLAAARPGETCGFEMAVRIVGEDEGRELNKRFRRADKATNVLAFPADDAQLAALRGDTGARSLGDLVICGPVVLREALEQGKDPDHHWLHLLLHGTLHLLGYDHENAQDAAEMESLETRILATRGIADPYTAVDDV
jgi:probable rRNA maturation factor